MQKKNNSFNRFFSKDNSTNNVEKNNCWNSLPEGPRICCFLDDDCKSIFHFSWFSTIMSPYDIWHQTLPRNLKM